MRCPLLMMSQSHYIGECLKETCAWWMLWKGECAIVTIAKNIDRICEVKKIEIEEKKDVVSVCG